jgi:hypothetical protein
MKPPTFEEAKEPLAADAWIRAIEAKFFVFTLPCSEERKASFAALQLCGAAFIWWENFQDHDSRETSNHMGLIQEGLQGTSHS